MLKQSTTGILPAAAGLATLAVVMGIGRFVFTPLLPGMMETHGFDEEVAGIMAAWNYAGYLAGVLLMRNEKPGMRRYRFLVANLALSLATTAGMGWVSSVPLWHAMRFFSGLASGACFVLCSSIVLDALAAVGRPVLAGFVYSGVGIGIALGGSMAPAMEGLLGPDKAWVGMGSFCIPLALFAFVFLHPKTAPAPVPASEPARIADDAASSKKRFAYLILLVSYFLEGFGYIIGATFLVALVKTTTDSVALANVSWIVTGLAAAVSAPLWRIAARSNYLRMLVAAFLLQGVGVLLPALSSAPAMVLAGGLLLGGTFMGITVLSLQYGVSLSGKPSAHTVAVMTALYGVGQIIGPFVAGMTAKGGAGFGFSFILSSLSLFTGALLLAGSRMRSGRG